jgi:rRNA maturation RNase YbeY
MGSPSGATCSNRIVSPGTKPISISLIEISSPPNSVITASWPGFNSDSFTPQIYTLDGPLFFTIFEIMSTPHKIRFFFENKSVSLKERTRLKKHLLALFKKEGKRVDAINYIFCSDKRLLEINRQFLQHDYYTDIITFDLSESDQISAEIYISTDRVRENAKTLKTTLKSELLRVILHGALHLCGYRDKTKGEKMIMREKENQYLKEVEGK